MSYSMPVAVFDADGPPALAFIRSLVRAGVPVDVYSDRRVPPARFARGIRSFQRCPAVEQFEAFRVWLRDRVSSGRVQLVAPTSDLVVFHLAHASDGLPPPILRSLANSTALNDVLFKDRFRDRCEQLGIPSPAAAVPTSLDEAREMAKSLRYPLILKPRSHVGLGGTRGTVVHDESELGRKFGPLECAATSTSVLHDHPQLRWPFLQEYVPRAVDNLYSVAGLLAEDGAPVAALASRKRAQWPPTLGIGTAFQSLDDPRLVDLGVSVAQKILGRGLFELEFILDQRDGSFLAIDLNPRGYGQMALEIARGADLPLLWYRQVLGQPVDTPHTLRHDLVWTHAVPYHIGHGIRLLVGPGRRQALRAYREAGLWGRIDAYGHRRDPLPGLVGAARLLRNPRRLIGPYLKRARVEPTPAAST